MNKKERLDALKKTVLNGISLEDMQQAQRHFQENPGTLDLGDDEASVKRRRIGISGAVWLYDELKDKEDQHE